MATESRTVWDPVAGWHSRDLTVVEDGAGRALVDELGRVWCPGCAELLAVEVVVGDNGHLVDLPRSLLAGVVPRQVGSTPPVPDDDGWRW